MATLRRRLPGLVHVPLTMRAPGAARPTADLLSRLIPDPALRTVLCCGPQPFMQLVRAVAGSAGVPPDRLGEESLDLSVSQIHPTRQGTETLMRQFTFARSGKSFDCAETSTILAAVRAARLPLPSSCAQGVCGTCNTFKYTGAVAMAHAGEIRQRDIDGGFILPCVSRPLSGIVLD